jgi:signal transduction histidine kinase
MIVDEYQHRNISQFAVIEDNIEPALAPRTDWTEMGASEHFVQFYDTDTFLVDAVGAFVSSGLRAGDAAIVVATQAHREAIEERLRAAGLDVAAAIAGGQYLSLDAAEALSGFMVDNELEPGRFLEIFEPILARASENNQRVRIFGEMVALLALDGNFSATVRLEEIWNELQETHPFSLFCAYAMDQFDGQAHAELLVNVCAEHSRVIPAESYTALPSQDERLRAILTLQQKASWLEEEIAGRKRVEEQLRVALEAERAARQETEAALRLRDEFLSIAAHELRTPLTVLLGHTQLVERKLRRGGDLQPEQLLRGMQSVSSQADKITRLLAQLLDVSVLDAGKLALKCEPVDLAAIVQQAVSDARAFSDGHAITLTAPASLEARVDPLRIEQVLANLLNNALKYSPVESSIDVVISQPLGAEIELSVRDHGRGIPFEERNQIFERFYQAPDHGYTTGLGLGLYISHQIVELHGGRIRAEFPPDGGTRFIVTLPVAADVALAPASAD